MEWMRGSAQVKTTPCNYQNKHTFLKIHFQPACANAAPPSTEESFCSQSSIPKMKYDLF